MIRTKDWHIVIQGFTQHEGQMTGCLRLSQSLRALAGPQTFVGLREWNSNWKNFADYMQHVSDWGGAGPRVRIYAYSWGCGSGALELAEHLAARNIDVEHAVFCDPVYHSRIPLWIARGIGVLRRGTIDVPSRVRRVSWLRQFKNLPGGCDLKPTARDTVIDPPIELPLEHESIDESPEFHRLACDVAGIAA